MKRAQWVLSVLAILALALGATPQSRPRVNPGPITVRGTGSSSGDVLRVTVAPRGRSGGREVVVKVPPGTRLRSSSGGAQSMVAAGVRGRSVGGNQFVPTSEIRGGPGTAPVTYILEAYCAEFHKANPGPNVTFTIGGQDRVLACIFREASGLSVAAKQAAVWIYTDHVSYRQMRAKFPVSQSEWAAAERAVRRCPAAARSVGSRKSPAAPARKRQPARRHR